MMNGVGIMDETHLKALNQTLVSFENIHHKYGNITSVEDISFQIQHGEIVSLLGPSGCGKTTMLRLAAGFETPSAGHITKNSIQISSPDDMLLPEHRNMGLVFQSYALFPHMTVEQNVAFGIKPDQHEEKAQKQRVADILNELDVLEYASCYPHELSGGQQQRVAVARAIAPSPDLILFDEPYSGLDSRLRERVRDRMLHILKSEKIAALIVTHDAEEAMFMSDKIIVLNDGRMMQQGRPIDLYCRPENAFVAEFFGEVNQIPATGTGDGQIKSIFGQFDAPSIEKDQNAVMILRYEGINVHTQSETAVKGEVTSTHLLGRYTLVHVEIRKPDSNIDLHLHARLPGLNFLHPGQDVFIEIDPSQAFIFPASM